MEAFSGGLDPVVMVYRSSQLQRAPQSIGVRRVGVRAAGGAESDASS